MAIKFKELNDRLKLSPLSDKELAAVSDVEKWIDADILKLRAEFEAEGVSRN